MNYYNYGDKDKININVFVWGSIRVPGKYLIPQGTTLVELDNSYAEVPLMNPIWRISEF